MVGVMMSVLISMDHSNVCVILPDMKLELTIRRVWVSTTLVKLFHIFNPFSTEVL